MPYSVDSPHPDPNAARPTALVVADVRRRLSGWAALAPVETCQGVQVDPSADRQVRERNLLAVRGAFEAVSAGDAHRQLTHYTDDLVIELPFTSPPVRVEGKAGALDYLARAFEQYRIVLTIINVIACEDPDSLVVESSSEGTFVPTGSPYSNVYITVFEFREGRISSQREFFPPA